MLRCKVCGDELDHSMVVRESTQIGVYIKECVTCRVAREGRVDTLRREESRYRMAMDRHISMLTTVTFTTGALLIITWLGLAVLMWT